MTPSTPFRPPASRPYSTHRSNAGSQFASTPRFLFSQQPNSTQNRDDGKELVDDISNESPSTVRYVDRDGDAAIARGDVIEDVEEYERDVGSNSGILDNELDNTPTGSAEVNSEFEDLFGPVERTKRRRLSPGPDVETEAPLRLYERMQDDAILTSSPDMQSSWNDEPPVTPFPRRPRPQLQDESEGEVTATPKPSTPAMVKPAFRYHPRFLLSASQQPRSSQTRTPFTPAPSSAWASSQPPTSSQRRKPAFVLPRSPSPSRADEDPASLPTPFSPSSRTLHRRGRRRHDAPGYVPGGMAAEIRSWVLEMGTKREQLDSSVRFDLADAKKYLLTARITRVVRQSVLRSSGAVAFVEAQIISENNEEDRELRNILLMGSPRHQSGDSELEHGRVIGVCRGLVWEIELDEDGIHNLAHKDGLDVGNLNACPSNANDRERWLVVMEWDFL